MGLGKQSTPRKTVPKSCANRVFALLDPAGLHAHAILAGSPSSFPEVQGQINTPEDQTKALAWAASAEAKYIAATPETIWTGVSRSEMEAE